MEANEELRRVSRSARAELESLSIRRDLRQDEVFAVERGIYLLDSVAAAVWTVGPPRFEVGVSAAGEVLGAERLFVPRYAPLRARALNTGSVRIVDFDRLRWAMERSRSLESEIMRLALASSARHFHRASEVMHIRSDRRLARWIQEYADALDVSELHATHAEIATIMGLRRSSVTDGMHLLEERKFVRSQRRRISICDRSGLAAYAAGVEASSEPASRRPTSDTLHCAMHIAGE